MADDSGGLGGLLGWFGRPYDPQAAYEGLLSSQATQDALRARSLASVAQAFGAGAGSDARGSAIPFGATMGNAAAAAYGGQDELIKARLLAAQQQQSLATAGLEQGKLKMLPELLKAYQNPALYGQGDTKPAPGTPLARVSGGGGDGGETYWTPQGLAALRPTEGAYDQIHYPSGSPSTASGAYGFLDSTWQQQAPKAGVDIEKYPRAYLAPPEVQDKVAAITPISHWTGTDAKGNPYNFRAQRLATNPAYVTGGEPRQAGDGGREPTAAEAAVYAQTPGTVQNAAKRAPTDAAFWNTAQPTGLLGAGPSGAPLGPAVAPPTPPGGTPATPPVAPGPQALTSLLDQAASAAPRAPLVPSAPPPAPAMPPGQQGAAVDPATQQTLAAIEATRGGGVNAAPPINGGLLASMAPGAAATMAAAAGGPPPVDPRLAQLAQAGPPTATDAAPAPPRPQAQALEGLLAQKAAQESSAAPPVTQGGGLLPQGPVPPPAPAPAANAPPAAPVVPPAGTVPPAAAPGGIPLPALPPMPTLPAAPQMPNIPIPPVAAGTQQEQIAQNIAGISALVGMPAPPWIQDLAKMPATRATELYKGYVTAATNQMNERYKTELQLSTTEYIKAAEQKGMLPGQIQLKLAEQGRWINPQTGQAEFLPGWIASEGQKAQQAADIETKKQFDIEAAKGGITQALAQRTGALDAVRSLENSTEARKLLDQGIITGKGANTLLEFGKALQVIGFHQKDDPIANTEAYAALRASEVGRMIKQFGSGTGLSDADREYASKMAAGNITANEQSIRKIIDISDRASNRLIDDYNKEAARLGSRFIPPVQKPDLPAQTQGGSAEGQPPPRVMHDPQSGWEIIAPPGSKQWMWSNGPNAGKPYAPPGGR